MKNMEHRKLIEQIRLGDARAEQAFFEKYEKPILWKLTRRIFADKEDIEDLASEIYLAIFESLRKPDFQPERWENLDAFVWGVTNNKIRDWFKKEKRKKKTFQKASPGKEPFIDVDQYFIETKETQKILKRLLNELEPKFQEVLHLRYFEELAIQEISKLLNLPPRRVSERIHYALKKLRKACQRKNLTSILSFFILLFNWKAELNYAG